MYTFYYLAPMDNHARFLKHLDQSSKAVFVVAHHLHRKGLDVRVNATRRASSHKEWKKFKDDGDMFVYRGGNEYRIEVKGSRRIFTCGDDWPFDNVFICAVHSYDLAEKKPYAYFVLSGDMKHVGIVNTDTYPKWRVMRKKDRRYENVEQDFYTCPIELVKWEKIDNGS